MDLHCGNSLHARMIDGGLVEVSCRSRWCGKLPGNVVLHRFNAETGELVETLKFKAPPQPQDQRKGSLNGSR